MSSDQARHELEEPLSLMSQETYVNINDLHKQGWTISEIAAETAWHRTTVSDRLKNGPPPTERPTEATVMTDRWRSKIDSMLEQHPRLLAVSIHNMLRAEGFDGSSARCGGMILSWSRFRIWWSTTTEDRQHTFEGAARFFDEIGGVPVAWTPAARLEVERGFLGPLPRARFDSDYVETRRVHNAWPFIAIDANRYSVPPEALGHKVEIRRKVDADTVEIRLAGRLIATHRLVTSAIPPPPVDRPFSPLQH